MRKKILQYVVLILLFIVPMSLGRLYFFLKYRTAFNGTDAGQVVASFLQGLRFDLSTASIVLLPLLMLLFLPGAGRSRAYTRWLLRLMLAWYLLLLGYNFMDIQYYAFTQRHFTFELSNTWRDTDVIMRIGLKKYLPEFVAFAVFSAAYAATFLRLTGGLWSGGREAGAGGRRVAAAVLVDAAAVVAIAAVSVVLARGGLQTKPLSIKNAFANEKTELGVLSLNGIYTTFNTVYNSREDRSFAARLGAYRPARPVDFASVISPPERESAGGGYPLFRRFKTGDAQARPLNVVVFVMESWSAKFTGSLGGSPDAAPFFGSISKDGLLVENCFANAQRSYEGLSATLGSLPVWKGMVLDQGGLLYQTRLEPPGTVFKKRGYETLFVHGARAGSMGFDGLVKRLGIDRHISRDDFTAAEGTDDGVWGIYDEYAFLRAHEEFEAMRSRGKPFFAVVYSLTSHTPYRVPSERFEYFGKDVESREFLNAMRYSDYALGRFFEKARGSGYYADTLFVITADHTEGSSTGTSLYDSYRIPCLFYSPGVVRPGRFGGAASQADIMPTVYDIMRLPEPFTGWGKSVLSPGKRASLLPRGDLFVWVDGPLMLSTDLDRPVGLYDYTKDPRKNLLKDDPETAARMNDELMQYLKFSYSLIINNNVRPATP